LLRLYDVSVRRKRDYGADVKHRNKGIPKHFDATLYRWHFSVTNFPLPGTGLKAGLRTQRMWRTMTHPSQWMHITTT